jgi:hypothetical protein
MTSGACGGHPRARDAVWVWMRKFGGVGGERRRVEGEEGEGGRDGRGGCSGGGDGACRTSASLRCHDDDVILTTDKRIDTHTY